MKDLHLLTNFYFHLSWCHSYFYLLAQPLLLTFCHCGQLEWQTWWIFQALKTLVLSNHCVGVCSVLMPAHKSSSQLLCSQLKQLQWASGECTPNVLRAFGAELKPVFFFLFLYPQYFSQQTIFTLHGKSVSQTQKLAFSQTIHMPAITMTLTTAIQSFHKMLQHKMIHHQTKSGCKTIHSSEDRVERYSRNNHIFITCAITVILTTMTAKQSFHKTLWLMMMFHTKFCHKRWNSSEDIILDNHSMKFWTFAVTLTLNTAKQSFHKADDDVPSNTVHRRFTSSEDIIH